MKRLIIFLSFWVFLLGVIGTAESAIVISEVMANPAEVGDDHDEFIELYNNGGSAVDVNGWKFTDGDALDTIEPWVEATHGNITDPDPTFSTSVIPTGGYAVILDEEYEEGTQPYGFPQGVIILTVGNTTLGDELQNNDPITLFDGTGTEISDVVSTYGTPVSSDNWANRVDDGLDGIPLNPSDGKSAERKHPGVSDDEDYWAASQAGGGTPGAQNSVYDSSLPVVLSSFTAIFTDHRGNPQMDHRKRRGQPRLQHLQKQKQKWPI